MIEIGKIKNGSVRVLTTYPRCYSKKNLAKLFKKHGFEVELTFATCEQGHLIHEEEDPSKKALQVGVIVKMP